MDWVAQKEIEVTLCLPLLQLVYPEDEIVPGSQTDDYEGADLMGKRSGLNYGCRLLDLDHEGFAFNPAWLGESSVRFERYAENGDKLDTEKDKIAAGKIHRGFLGFNRGKDTPLEAWCAFDYNKRCRENLVAWMDFNWHLRKEVKEDGKTSQGEWKTWLIKPPIRELYIETGAVTGFVECDPALGKWPFNDWQSRHEFNGWRVAEKTGIVVPATHPLHASSGDAALGGNQLQSIPVDPLDAALGVTESWIEAPEVKIGLDNRGDL